MTDNFYQWPDPIRLYPDQGKKSYRLKRFRFHLRSLLHQGNIKRFEQFINQHPTLAGLLNSRPSFSYPLAHRFLDKRFSTKQRFAAICENLHFLPEKFTALGLPQLWEKEMCFGEVIEDFELYLCLNYHQAMEGYWALELRYKPTGQLIYLLTFGKVEQSLLIAVIQGPNFEGSKELVKVLTKKCHGLRPAYLMVEAMKALTNALGYDKLLGIPHKYQNKSRLVQSKRYVVDYDAIFAESAGELKDYWELPVQFAMKDMDSIPSNKRSMYRKRYAMLEQLQASMKQTLQH
ncbi:VirK/YbjX family protein [Pasteurella multocida]|uniref:VirK/YbjX family protein n=1 Tax=Pasteurella multocida TaxID=747 RepID=UPI0020244B5C|nr:VirK/YbjX family protein [Pasteurella multocida]URJ91357.1 VirK/YbjX family protein [Pasteurella multocida]WRK04758.1 VirK/YbjX family protein [Pasteurella multocida]HDR0627756.1 VirK/YbjX family protein [Pasteurella multocida]HDR1433650.1 VirK/YbjX family protein [Pasteurella multocida]HDR1791302.1 VirK/YbjX family protein [Pasteurella multocida]